jgi:hypothetical protein
MAPTAPIFTIGKSVMVPERTHCIFSSCAKYKVKRYGKKSGILKANFIDLLINYS